MKTHVFFYIVCSLLFSITSAEAANTFDWIGGAAITPTAWTTATNWKLNGATNASGKYPGSAAATDIVNIGDGVSYLTNQPTLFAVGTITIATLNLGSTVTPTLTLSSPLTVSGAITIAGTSTITGGSTLTGASLGVNSVTLNLNTPLSLSGAFTATTGSTVNANISGTISAASMSITTSAFTLNAASTLSGALTFANGSSTYNSTALTTAVSMTTNTGTLTLGGALNIGLSGITVKGTTINGSAVAAITTVGMSLTSATVTLNGVLTSTAVVQVPSPGGTDCTLTTNAAGNSISQVYDHTGSNLTWNGTGTTSCAQGDVSSGQTLTIGAGNTVTFTGNFEMHGSNPQVGLLVNNGTINTNSSFFSDNINTSVTAITNNSGGIINLTGTATLNLGSYTNLSNSGTMNAASGTSISAAASSTITNNSSSTINLTSATMNINGNPSTLSNSGTLNFTSSTLNATGAAPVISNTGTINAVGTTANLSGNNLSFTNSGTVAETSGSQFNFGGNPQSITNSGTLSYDASTITVSGNTTPITNSGNITLTNASTFTISGGSSSSLTNSGNFNATSSTLAFSAGSGNTITNSGNFTATSTPVTFSAGAWTVNNTGNLNALSGSTILMPGNNSSIRNTTGTFTVSASNITLNGQPSSVQNSGSGTFSASGSVITLAQSAFLQQTSSNGFTINGGSTVNFGYGAYISNTGNFYAGTTNSQCILNITSQTSNVANSTSNGKFYLGSTSIINLSGASSNVTNTSPATFTLQSDANGSAAIGIIPSNSGGMVGTYSVERYFQGSATYDAVKNRWKGRNYRIISSPVNTGSLVTGTAGNYYIYGLNYIVGATAGQTTAASSTTNAFVTGATGGSTSAGNPSLYLYRENKAPSNATFTSGNFIGLTNITSATALGTSDAGPWTIPAGNGVFFFFRGNATSFATRTKSPYIAPENVTLTSTGNLNQQLVTVYDWYTPNSAALGYTSVTLNSAVRGYNMVGNPYACSIDWNTAYSNTGITRTNVNPTIYVFNPVTNQYDTYITTSSSAGTATGSASSIIASGQGFFVQANNTGAASLTFTENAKSATSQLTGSNLLMSTSATQNPVAQMLRLKLIIDTLNYDDIVIGFNSTAATKYNQAEDSEYLPGTNALLGFSSFSDDSVKLAINYLPLPRLKPQVIRLRVDARVNGRYTLQKTQLDAIPQIYEIWLMDKYKKDSLDLRANSVYVFDINLSDTSSYGSNRFEVIIRQNTALALHLLDFTAIKQTAGAQVVWKAENEQNYTNFTVERSTDNGVTFDVLGGFTSRAQGTYSFLDKNPPAAADQYRLKLEDLNGTITYSKVVTLVYGSPAGSVENSNISIYPNPASNVINLAINKTITSNGTTTSSTGSTSGANQGINASYNIKIVSISGTLIKTETSAQPDTWKSDVSTLSPGTYIIQVINNSDKSVVGKGTFIKL